MLLALAATKHDASLWTVNIIYALPVSLVPFIAAIHNSFNACSVVMSMALAVYKNFPQTSCVVLILFCLTNGGAHHNYSQKIVISIGYISFKAFFHFQFSKYLSLIAIWFHSPPLLITTYIYNKQHIYPSLIANTHGAGSHRGHWLYSNTGLKLFTCLYCVYPWGDN